eukprot:TRINITY_DN955_c5_g1_i1.p1 TRINITY_DN955_c5_g1~~TRINITY_DN955_c5_g1_i1.p1  ORF type:complete len:265 (+),score=39.08 TRINITY_DN955_c5_g1_i1:238-1032(+)
MFHLLYGLWKSMFQKNEYRVLLVGLHNAGKTTLLEKAKSLNGLPSLPSDKIAPTVGLNLARIELRRCKVLLWDLGGQSSLRPIWKKYFEQTHAMLFVCDAAVPASDPRWREVRQTLREALSSPALVDVPLMVLANKQDQPGALSAQEVFDLLTDAQAAADDGPLAAPAQAASSPVSPRMPVGGVSQRRAGNVSPISPPLSELSPCSPRSGSPETRPAPSLPALLAGRAAYRIAPVCALDGSGVVEAIDWLVALLLLRERNAEGD